MGDIWKCLEAQVACTYFSQVMPVFVVVVVVVVVVGRGYLNKW